MQARFGGALSPTVKAVVIGAIVLVLFVPLAMLDGLMRERAGLRDQAYDRVALGWGGALTTGGPVVVVPLESRSIESSTHRVHREELFVLPTRLDASVQVQQESEMRYVGIYTVPVFTADVTFTGTFDFAGARQTIEARYPDRDVLWQQARVRLPLSDPRGVRELRKVRFGNERVTFSPGAQPPFSGLEAAMPIATAAPSDRVEFAFELRAAGSREIAVLPVGSTSRIEVRSDWPHPSFMGAYLPASREIDASGFTARWQILELNRTYGSVVAAQELDPGTVQASAVAVALHQPIDVYQRGERALKYALLFIALTFMTIFAWEHLARLPLHPLQYLLVGFALSIFYLLLLALSEHVPFALAYWLAAAALVALIGIYLAGALRKRRRGAVAAAALLAVYGVSYVLVISESYALLMGAIVLFIVLAIVMIATRRVDWHARAPRNA